MIELKDRIIACSSDPKHGEYLLKELGNQKNICMLYTLREDFDCPYVCKYKGEVIHIGDTSITKCSHSVPF